MPYGPAFLLQLLWVAMGVLYPILVFLLFDRLAPAVIAFALLVLVSIRYFLQSETSSKLTSRLTLLLVFLFFLFTVIVDSKNVLKLYPIAVSLLISASFFYSFRNELCLIEKLARKTGDIPPPEARRYLRCLNALWGALLLINALVSAYTAAYMSLSHWTFYNGFLSYILLATFFCLEYIFRIFYKRKIGIGT